MNPQLNTQQVFLLLGTAAAIVGVLLLAVILLVRSLRKERKEMNTPFNVSRAQDDSVFMIASLQGVVAGLKAHEKELETQLREAETRAEINQRMLETIVRATPQGLITFDAVGTVGIANQAAKNMLSLDTHARRSYQDIFAAQSPLALAIQSCLENPSGARTGRARYSSAEGLGREFDVTVYPFTGRGGQIAGVVCVFTVAAARETP